MLIYDQYSTKDNPNIGAVRMPFEFKCMDGQNRSFQQHVSHRPDLVYHIEASGPELLYILQRFNNIPTAPPMDGAIRWSMPWARFIAENLP